MQGRLFAFCYHIIIFPLVQVGVEWKYLPFLFEGHIILPAVDVNQERTRRYLSLELLRKSARATPLSYGSVAPKFSRMFSGLARLMDVQGNYGGDNLATKSRHCVDVRQHKRDRYA